MEQVNINQKAIATYGMDAQLNQVIEECAELILAIRHERRGKASRQQVIEEVADVQIMLDQMGEMYGVEAVRRMKMEKLDRLARRLGV